MLSNLLRGGAVTAFFTYAALAIAADPIPATAQASGNHYRAKQILGAQIMIQNNTAIGTIDDIVFDAAGNLEYLIVNNEGKLTTVPFEAAQFNVEKKTAVLTITPDQYKSVPTYTTTTYPNFYAPTYRTEIYKQYGLTPRQLRVIERRQ